MKQQTATHALREASTSIMGGVLQRKCACGTHTIAGGECESCQKEGASSSLQRVATNKVAVNEVPPVVHEVLHSSGQPLDADTRSFFESRFNHDFSHVRVHTDAKAAASARAVNALAYTVGRDVVFGTGQYSSGTSEGRRLLAHELTHVAQQGGAVTGLADQVAAPDSAGEREAEAKAEVVIQSRSAQLQTNVPLRSDAILQRYPDDVLDAGVPPLPAGVVDTMRPRRPVSELSDRELGAEYEDAEQLALSGLPDRLNAIEEEIENRVEGFGTAVPAGLSPRIPANKAITPDIALKVLDNLSRGEPPFRPDLSKGGAEWVVTEGNPYTSVKPSQSINVEVEIPKSENPLVFKEADLTKLFEQESEATVVEAEAKFRQRFNIEEKAALSSRLRKNLARFRREFAESRMWDRVGEAVRDSPGKVGEVILEPGSKFSKTPGKFGVVADAAKVQLKGGPGPLVETLTKAGVSAEPPILEAAAALAKKLKWAGRVRGAFRYGGRILIVVAVGYDLYKIYRAKDTVKAVVTSAGGWAGAIAAGTAFTAWFAPADTAGPWAWAAHGVGALIAGGIGYWVGSETTRYIYELAVE